MVSTMEGLATGREALDRHLAARAPVHEAWVGAPLLRWDEGGPEPLSRVVYLEEDGVWRFVGHGLTELDEKTSDDQELSGWGFEVTMAVRRVNSSLPTWPLSVLQDLARHVRTAHDVLAEGDEVRLVTPVGSVAACLFTADPLGSVETPFGRVRFVQAIGITSDELEAVRTWQSTPFLDLLRERLPHLATDPERRSILEDPEVKRAVELGSRREGSSTGEGRAELLAVRPTESGLEVTLDARTARDLGRMLPARLPFERPYRLEGPTLTVAFVPEGHRVPTDQRTCVVELAPRQVEALSARLEAKRGIVRGADLAGLSVRVEPLEVRDDAGQLLEVIG